MMPMYFLTSFLHRLSGYTVSYLRIAGLLFLLCGSAHALTPDDARHLLERTSFGASKSDIEALLPLSREQAVSHVLASLDTPQTLQPPFYISQPRPNYWDKDWEKESVMFRRINEMHQLQDWWMQEMIETPAPFAERLTLFWHNHFVSRFQNTRVSAPFYDQLQLFRHAGTTNFRELLRGILRDPMMLSGLDNVKNTRTHPNENLARELMELFTLGIGHYSEQDVKQVARLLAGHTVAQEGGWRYQVNEQERDTGEKTILGQSVQGSADGELDQLVDILLRQPSTAERIVGKLYYEFVSLKPNEAEIHRLAAILRDNHYDLRALLNALLLSDAFWAEENRGNLVKSPLDMIVGFARTFRMRLPDYRILTDYAAVLWQEPFNAPDVSGWKGGLSWLTSGQITNRKRIIERLWVAVSQSALLADKPVDGLHIRFSSEYRRVPATFRVSVNQQPVATITANAGLHTQCIEKASNESAAIKPMWENAVIPSAALPPHPKTVTVSLTLTDVDTHLFINWIALNGQRYNPYRARWVNTTAGVCPIGVPLGSFYCHAELEFSLDDTDSADQASLKDLQTPLNFNLEYGTARLQLAPRAPQAHAASSPRPPAPLPPLMPVLSDEAAVAMQATSASQLRELQQQMYRIMSLDPAYNLK
ncbi:DUF1800 domain-containing protein [Dickeya zeae]|uniref:DUF1800 domain-containing protein n=1 Tax=Dickeya zeae TaxID=204042 RepID=UPI001CF9EC42|nr:DUF1800 domain-containing protein [Dickeya zeae]UCZ76719.1 DUF1800 domain-containing protein [Dickeya zeae]